MIDIESIEPVQGTRFEMRYLKQQSYFTNAKSLKVEVYDSKHLADLMDCHEQVLKLIEESEKRLDDFV